MPNNFDFKSLANSIVNNGQFRLPPMDNLRLGRVIGYDPSYNYSLQAHSYPTVSVTIGGDSQVVHGIRFADTYTPVLGDTVWITMSGEDLWVLGSMTSAQSDIPNDVVGFKRSSATTVSHGDFTSSTVINAWATPIWWKQLDPVVTSTVKNPFLVSHNVLPNRIYKAELLISFTVSGTASSVSVGVVTPDGLSATASTTQVPHQVFQSPTTAGQTYTVSATTTWWDNNPTHYTNVGAWAALHPNNQGFWGVAFKVGNAATTLTMSANSPQRLMITDLGVHS